MMIHQIALQLILIQAKAKVKYQKLEENVKNDNIFKFIFLYFL